MNVTSGQGGALLVRGVAIGTLGAWAIRTDMSGRPRFLAEGCRIASFWCSAGVTQAEARPLLPERPNVKLIICGRVVQLSEGAVTLADITIE